MKYKINSYLGALIITIAGAAASLIIIHVAYANVFTVTLSGGGAYPSLHSKNATLKK